VAWPLLQTVVFVARHTRCVCICRSTLLRGRQEGRACIHVYNTVVPRVVGKVLGCTHGERVISRRPPHGMPSSSLLTVVAATACEWHGVAPVRPDPLEPSYCNRSLPSKHDVLLTFSSSRRKRGATLFIMTAVCTMRMQSQNSPERHHSPWLLLLCIGAAVAMLTISTAPANKPGSKDSRLSAQRQH